MKKLEADLKAQRHRVKKISVTNVAYKRLGLDARTVHSFIHPFVINGSFPELASHRRV